MANIRDNSHVGNYLELFLHVIAYIYQTIRIRKGISDNSHVGNYLNLFGKVRVDIS